MPSPSSLPIVLVPGFMCDDELWRDQSAALRAHGDCIVADFSNATSLTEAASLILLENPGRFRLAGFSLGGYVAQEILRLAPERVERLALIDTAMQADSAERRAERDALSRAALAPGTFTGMTMTLMRGYLHPKRLDDASLTGRIQAMTTRLGRDVFLRQNNMIRPDGREALAAYCGPALVLCGAEDRITPVSISEEMARTLPAAELQIIPDCGHMAPMERPDAVTHALIRYFSA